MEEKLYFIHTTSLPALNLVIKNTEQELELFFSKAKLEPIRENNWEVLHPISEKKVDVSAQIGEMGELKVFVNGVLVEIEITDWDLSENVGDVNYVKLFSFPLQVVGVILFLFLGVVGYIGILVALVLTRITFSNEQLNTVTKYSFAFIWWAGALFYWYYFEYVGRLTLNNF